MPKMHIAQRKAIFLDRDGTINFDAGYTWRMEDWKFLPGARQALALLKKAGWLLVVISNQSGIGRHFYGESDLLALQNWVNAQLFQDNAAIDAWYHCPHLPTDNCACRKPRPGLILQAATDLAIDLPSSWMLGDKPGDVFAGRAAGCQAGLITSDSVLMAEAPAGTPVWPDLATAASAILALQKY